MARLFLLNHPSAEQTYAKKSIGATNIINWNTTPLHKRKFINRNGMYLKNDVPTSGNLCFWGEYEPYSQATIISKGTPKAVHRDLRSVCMLLPMPSGALNTDPYVFGCFRNICCRRRAKYKKGDIIIFGKFTSATLFEFDTVIVVEKLVPCSLVSKNDQYRLASIDPLSPKIPVDFVDGMMYSKETPYYSFVPCIPYCDKDVHAAGFKKPVLDLNKLFGRNAKKEWRGRTFANVPMRDAETIRSRWNQILAAVKKAGLEQGVYIDKIDNEKIIF